MRAVEGSLGHSPEREVERIRRPSLGEMARLGVPVGGRVRTLRAVEIIPAIPYQVIVRCGLLNSLFENPSRSPPPWLPA